MYCSNCGKPLPDGSRACPYCGAPSGGFAPFTAYQPNITEDNIPDEWKPISMWGYFGYEILFSIPLIGLILLIVFPSAERRTAISGTLHGPISAF